MDTSNLLDDDGTLLYQSLIGAIQWAVSLTRMDIATAVMTLSGFRIAPQACHLVRIKRVYGYISQFKDAAIRFRTNEPDYSGLSEQNYDWMSLLYGYDRYFIPDDIPEPLGKRLELRPTWMPTCSLTC